MVVIAALKEIYKGLTSVSNFSPIPFGVLGGGNTMVVLGFSWVLCTHGASFQGLGAANVQGVSADGLYVVGSRSTANGPEAFRWTATGGMVGLGVFPSSTPNSQGVAVSSNGAVVVGHSLRTNGFEAFRWTEGGDMVGLGELPGGVFQSFPYAVSASGGVVVGYSSSEDGREAFRWDGRMVGLGDFFQNDFQSAAYALSADGSVVVGYGYSASGPEAFRWTPGGGMVGLSAPNQDRFGSRASSVSADGTIIVGYAFYPDSGVNGLFQPFRWTQAGGMVKLGDLQTGVLTTYAPAVLISGNGDVVVGNGFFPTEPFMWDAGHGIRNLRDVFVNWYGLNLNDWTLTRVTGISHDGLTIVGNGTRTSSGATEGWIARLGAGPLVGSTMQINQSNNQVILSWPVSADAWKLQVTSNLLDSNSWTTLTNSPIVLGGRIRVADPIPGTGRFYRLKLP